MSPHRRFAICQHMMDSATSVSLENLRTRYNLGGGEGEHEDAAQEHSTENINHDFEPLRTRGQEPQRRFGRR